MDPRQIAQMLASGDPEKIKAAQRELQGLGYYRGKIDGVIGEKEDSLTRTAAESFRRDAETQAAREADRLGAETRTRGLEAEAEAAKAKARSTEVENDPTNRLTKMGTEIAPYAAGVGAGTYIGHKYGTSYKGLDTADRGNVARLATERGLDPQVREGQLNRINSARGRRNISQFGAPAALGGMGYVTREVIAPAFSDPQTQDIIKGIGTGENAAAATLGIHQLGSTLLRGNPNDPVDEARIRSRPAAPPPDAPAQPPALRTPSDRLTSAARAAGAPSKGLNKTSAAKYLESNVTPETRAAVAAELGVGPGQKIASVVKKLSTSRKPSMIVGPMIAAGLGYDAASSDAEAAGATPAEAQTRGAVAGTGAAAVTGGAMYGASKLANFAPVKSLLNVASKASGPLMLNDMAVQAHRGIYGSGPQFLDVPEKSPVRSQLSNYTAEANGPLSSASALAVPGNIPPNAARDAEAAAMAAEGPSPARAAYGDQKFDTALSGFLAMIEEYNSSLQGAQ